MSQLTNTPYLAVNIIRQTHLIKAGVTFCCLRHLSSQMG